MKTKKTAKKSMTVGSLFELMSKESVVVSVNYYSDDQAPDETGKPSFYFMPYLLEVYDNEVRIDDMAWTSATKVQILGDGTAVAKKRDYTYLFRFYNLDQMPPTGPFYDAGKEQSRWFISE
jgi:hypothetical protein